MLVKRPEYFGDISDIFLCFSPRKDISEISPIYRSFKQHSAASRRQKISEKSAERWHFGENSDIFATFPGKKISDFKKQKSAWLFQKTSFLLFYLSSPSFFRPFFVSFFLSFFVFLYFFLFVCHSFFCSLLTRRNVSPNIR